MIDLQGASFHLPPALNLGIPRGHHLPAALWERLPLCPHPTTRLLLDAAQRAPTVSPIEPSAPLGRPLLVPPPQSQSHPFRPFSPWLLVREPVNG